MQLRPQQHPCFSPALPPHCTRVPLSKPRVTEPEKGLFHCTGPQRGTQLPLHTVHPETLNTVTCIGTTHCREKEERWNAQGPLQGSQMPSHQCLDCILFACSFHFDGRQTTTLQLPSCHEPIFKKNRTQQRKHCQIAGKIFTPTATQHHPSHPHFREKSYSDANQLLDALMSQCHLFAEICSQDCSINFKTHKTVLVDPAKTLTLRNKRGHTFKILI